MEQNVKSVFLSKKNLDFTFGVIKQNVEQRCNYTVKDKKVILIYQKMADSVYNSMDEDSRNLVSLNTKLIDASTNYFEKMFKNKNNSDSNVSTKSNRQQSDSTAQYMPIIENKPKTINKASDTEESNILPFTLSDEFISNFGTNDSEPLYDNMKLLEDNENVNTMQKLEEYTKSRDSELLSYQKIVNLQPETSKILQNKDDIIIDRNSSLVDIYNKNDHADPMDLLKLESQTKEKIMNDMSNNTISDNNASIVNNTNSLLSTILNYQRENQPKYIDKNHYVSINSSDRNVKNTNEDRYNFRVLFKGNSELGISVPNMFKNVISVEIVYAFFPEDTEIVGYDNRIHLSTFSNPYLLLHVDELSGVYSGTNSNNDRCFSHLVIDKEQNSNSLASSYVGTDINMTDEAGSAGTINTFDNQFQRTYLRYYPSCFDSKVFYNNPLASLSSMNIKITNPLGNKINNHPDVLKINTIAFAAAADKSLDSTAGFPRTALSDNETCVLTTSTYFSNRLFKVGDRLKISNVASNNAAFQNFINRDEGHIIINLDAENNTKTGTSANKGFINKIYISPPGTIDFTNGNLLSTSYHNTVGTLSNVSGTSIKGYILNLNLQSHFIFKIVTRDTDTKEIIKPLNV